MPDTQTSAPAAAELDRLVAAGRRWRDDGAAIATVVSTWGSAPRPRGSHMIVHRDGRFEGSVSGGCVENEILFAAADVIADGEAKLLNFTVNDEAAWEAHLPCGGAISVLVQPVAERGFDPALFDAIADARAHGRALAVTTDLASGASMAADAPRDGAFVNRYRPARRLLIVGAVQIAQALAGFAAPLDAATVVIDPRERFLTARTLSGRDAGCALARSRGGGLRARPRDRGGDAEPRSQDRRSRADRRSVRRYGLCGRAGLQAQPCGAAGAPA